MIGHVKWYDVKRGFGFIVDYHSNDEIFFGRHEIRANSIFHHIGEGQPVSYDLQEDGQGRPIAVNLHALSIDDILLDPDITEST